MTTVSLNDVGGPNITRYAESKLADAATSDSIVGVVLPQHLQLICRYLCGTPVNPVRGQTETVRRVILKPLVGVSRSPP